MRGVSYVELITSGMTTERGRQVVVFYSVHKVLFVLMDEPPVLGSSIRRKLPRGWHDMRHVQHGTNNSTEKIHRKVRRAGFTSTRASWHEDLKIDSVKDVGLVRGCALVDWRFDCGNPANVVS